MQLSSYIANNIMVGREANDKFGSGAILLSGGDKI